MEFVTDNKIAEELEDLYFDVDLSILDSQAFCERLSNTSNSPEFEFNMSSTSGACDTADELFFHGQLLPLHVSPRVMMVQRLSSSGLRSSQLPQIQEAKQKSCTFWEYWDKDIQDSSYRDSNGSSQDSSFNTKDEYKGRGNASMKNSGSGSSGKSSSWLKAALSWKFLFPFRKSKSKAKDSSRSVRSDREELKDFATSLHTASLVSSRSKSYLEPWSHAGDINLKTQINPEISQKSLKTSTTFAGKQDIRCRLHEQFWIEEASSRNPNNFSWNGSTFVKQPSCSSFLPRNLRASSFARRSSAPCSRVSSSQCSPTHSGVLSSFSYSTISDMQNAVQGAIAHCKQSHISKQAPF